VDSFARGGGVAVEPLREVRQFDLVLDADVCHADLHDALLKAGDPIAAAQRGESLGHGLVERFGGHLDGMGDAFEVLYGDAAGASGHEGERIRFAFVSPCPREALHGNWKPEKCGTGTPVLP
jgi:hypothetical protein